MKGYRMKSIPASHVSNSLLSYCNNYVKTNELTCDTQHNLEWEFLHLPRFNIVRLTASESPAI